MDTYCYACGHILPLGLGELPNATIRLDDDAYQALSPQRRWGTAYFAQENRLKLHFRDVDEELIVDISGSLVLGRGHDDPAVSQPDIDLTPVGAVETGVSRRHMVLSREHDTITVMDLGSSNNTYLNGQRLIPGEPRILRDGDELRLGRLVIRINFV
ncbi:MAG: FHA domain-containing protein [Anaerolineae bacterium]|nr:FHA domain-containing protein [Anaerolineae bacterium]